MPKSIFIVEGPDGAGKSTLAQALAETVRARLVHCEAFPHVSTGLGRLYVEAMLPALLGYTNIVLDRAWLSEPIYGRAYRKGADRLGVVGRRMLERVALRCNTYVVVCLPSMDVCLNAFNQRRATEYLDSAHQLMTVYSDYATRLAEGSLTDLPTTSFDYATQLFELPKFESAEQHLVEWRTGGNFNGKVVIVGESFGPLKNDDPLFRVPFVSFSAAGCSAWLTQQLADAGLSEYQLCWVNADDSWFENIVKRLHDDRPTRWFVALGQRAAQALKGVLGASAVIESVPHPQSAKRFHSRERYALVDLLKGLSHE